MNLLMNPASHTPGAFQLFESYCLNGLGFSNSLAHSSHSQMPLLAARRVCFGITYAASLPYTLKGPFGFGTIPLKSLARPTGIEPVFPP